VRVLELACEMVLLKLGTVALAARKSTPMPAGTTRCPTSILPRRPIEGRSGRTLRWRKPRDRAEGVDGMSIPKELARREDRLAKLAEPRAEIECAPSNASGERRPRIAPRSRHERSRRKATSNKPGGRPPLVEGP
jgi:hypothetical protein